MLPSSRVEVVSKVSFGSQLILRSFALRNIVLKARAAYFCTIGIKTVGVAKPCLCSDCGSHCMCAMPIGPLRCLVTITAAMPRPGVSGF